MLAHNQRSLIDVLETKIGRARDFVERFKGLLQEAMALWHAYRDGHRTDKADAAAPQAEITYHLRDRYLKHADNQPPLNELSWHHDRGNLVRFLADPRVSRPTIGQHGPCAQR